MPISRRFAIFLYLVCLPGALFADGVHFKIVRLFGPPNVCIVFVCKCCAFLFTYLVLLPALQWALLSLHMWRLGEPLRAAVAATEKFSVNYTKVEELHIEYTYDIWSSVFLLFHGTKLLIIAFGIFLANVLTWMLNFPSISVLFVMLYLLI